MSNILEQISSGKTAYQNYVVEHGIERIEVAIPLQNVKVFEAAFHEAGQDRKLILEAVAKANGKAKI